MLILLKSGLRKPELMKMNKNTKRLLEMLISGIVAFILADFVGAVITSEKEFLKLIFFVMLFIFLDHMGKEYESNWY